MYVVRALIESDQADSKAFEHLSDAQRHFRDAFFYYDVQSIAIFEVEATTDPKFAIKVVEEGNGELARLIEVINSQDLLLCRWYLAEFGLTDAAHLSTAQIMNEAREYAARLEALGGSFARRVPRST